jgi:hypothetical protein
MSALARGLKHAQAPSHLRFRGAAEDVCHSPRNMELDRHLVNPRYWRRMPVSLDPSAGNPNSVRVERELLCGFVKTISRVAKPSQLGRFSITAGDDGALLVTSNFFSLVLPTQGQWSAKINVAAGELFKAVGKVPELPRITIEIDGTFLKIGGVPLRFRKEN